jgi:hypothetical protein
MITYVIEIISDNGTGRNTAILGTTQDAGEAITMRAEARELIERGDSSWIEVREA